MGERVAAADIDKPVRLHSASNDAREVARGRVVAYAAHPMVCVETWDGRKIWWAAHLTERIVPTATPPDPSPTAADVGGEGGGEVANVPSEPQNGDLTACEHDWTQTGRPVQTSAASGRRCRKCARWEPHTDATLPGWQG